MSLPTSSTRPLPGISEATNPAVPLRVRGAESDSGGRRHVPSSLPRTWFSSGHQKSAMKKLKKLQQKMTFSDQSATSSAKSTPSKVMRKPTQMSTYPRPAKGGKVLSNSFTNPTRVVRHHKPAPRQAASFVPTSYLSDEGYSKGAFPDYASEGEIASNLTVSSLLSKLDSVKDFLKEAETMRARFDDTKNEPGMPAQLIKLDKLIDQLQQQESGYLGELIRLTELDDAKFNSSLGEVDMTYSEDEDSEEEEEEEEEEDSGAEFASEDEDNTVLAAAERMHRKSGSMEGSGSRSSLSLRAETELEKQAAHELLALQKQKDMLTQLLDKQKQIQELEVKQKALLDMKDRAEQQLKEAEEKGLQIEKLSGAAEASIGQPALEERAMLMAKFSELKARKEKVDKITELLLTLKDEGDLREALENTAGEAPPTQVPEEAASQGAAKSSHAIGGGASELVVEDSSAGLLPPNIEQLQMRLREAAEARKKLLEARKFLSLQTEAATGEEVRLGVGEGKEEKSWKSAWPPQEGDRAKESVNSWQSDEEVTALEQSLTSDYESNLAKKKEEVAQLLQEREELKATHSRLLALQKKMHFRQFFDDSARQNHDQEAVSQTDLTAATWGGSTVQSDPEDTASSVSLPSDIAADITQEANRNAEALDRGDSATVEQEGRGKTPPFSVTRHTPRARANVRLRTHSVDSTEVTLRAEKKIKIEAEAREKLKAKRKAARTGPLKNPLSAAAFKPSFSPPKQPNLVAGGASMSFGVGGPRTSNPPVGGASGVGGASEASGPQAPSLPKEVSEHTATLQNQLALTSHMCNQLLYGQNNLIRAVCERLDRPEFGQVEERMAVLQQYQLELEQYYQQLYASYAQMQQCAEEANDGVAESEEPVIPAFPQPPAAPGRSPPTAGDPSTAVPPHLAQFYPPLYVLARPEGAMPTASPAAESFLPPPPPPLGNPYASPQRWMYPFNPYLQAPPVGVEQSPSRYYQDRPHNPMPGPGLAQSMMGFNLYNKAPGNTSFGASFDGQGFPQFGGAGPGFGPMESTQAGKEGVFSPSGVTGSSMQVHPPSSPPIDPSVSIQPTPLSANHISYAAVPAASTGSEAGAALGASHVTQVDTMVGGGGVKDGAAERKEVGGEETKDGGESLSSLPMSVPEGTSEAVAGSEEGEGLPAGFSVFDALRDTIYSEVATLIANNENRPHFLVELFRELQMLNTDYLRQRALYNLQDLVTRYLTEEAVTSEANAVMDKQYQAWLGEVAGSASEEEGGSSVVRSKPTLQNRPSLAFDYIEAANSASSVSTPTNEPFASDDLGETVIKLDKMKLVGNGGGLSTASPLKTDASESLPDAMPPFPDINTHALDEQIKGIMMEVIPVLKENIEKECSSEMSDLIRDRIVSLVVEQEQDQSQDYLGAFRKQLEVTVKAAMDKYLGRKFRECGEDLLMDVSEVLFNELTFFKLMEDFKGHPQLNGDYRSITSSQTTTEAEDTSFAEGAEPQGPGEPTKLLDPALLQVLSYAANLTFQEEEDALGKSRDDSLATAWDPKLHSQEQSSPSADELDMVELSVSESQPIHSVGSEEEEEEEGCVEPAHPPNQSMVGAAGEGTEGVGDPPEATSPTVIVTPADEPSPNTSEEGVASPESKDEGNVSIGKVSAISKEDGTEKDHPALSPPPSAQEAATPQITTLTEDAVEARMKAEQRIMEGVDGILSSLSEQDQGSGLVGDGNEVAGPVSANGI